MNNQVRILSHEQREAEVFSFFNGVISETSAIYLKNDNNIDIIPLRIQMIIIFSLIDIFASYWYEYKGEVDGQKDRFISWYENFCRINKNKEYINKHIWSEISSNRMYNFRSSLVHFFGMSEKSEEIYLALVSNYLQKVEMEALELQINKTAKSIIIKPHEFYILVKNGATLMLESWIQNIRQANEGNNDKKTEHIDGIERIWEKIQKEGAVQIMKPIK